MKHLIQKLKKLGSAFEKSSNATQRKRAHTKFKNLETELAPIFKKCCLKLKVFEEYLQRVNPELKSIARDLHNLELSKKDLAKIKRKGVKLENIKSGLKQARSRFRMEPDELVTLIKSLRKNILLIRLKLKWLKQTLGLLFRLLKSTPIEDCLFSISYRRETWD